MKFVYCILLSLVFMACKKDGTSTVVENDSVSLPVRAYYYSGDAYEDTLIGLSGAYDAMDSIYYDADHQVVKIVTHFSDDPEEVVFDFTYGSDGRLSQMKGTAATSPYGRTYNIFYTGTGRVDSIYMPQMGSKSANGFKFVYNSNGQLAASSQRQFFSNNNGVITSQIFTYADFHRDNANVIDTLHHHILRGWGPVNENLSYDSAITHFSPFSPADTAIISSALLFRAANMRAVTLDGSLYINNFFMQFLSPADMMLYRDGIANIYLGDVGVKNLITRNADKTLSTIRNFFGDVDNKYILRIGIKYEYQKFKK